MFAQESVMDIQKEREVLIAEIEVFKAEMLKSYVIKAWADSYVNTDLFSYAIFEDENNKIWWMKAQTHEFWRIWQAAKAQAVPEGFVVVAKELPEKIAEKMAIDRIDKPIHENDPVWSEIAEDSYKNQVKLKKWEFWRDYKAMIEAQEPAND